MVRCYPWAKGDASANETWIAAAVGTLMRYPVAVVVAVTHPVTGLPGRCNWIPPIAVIRQACEEECAPLRRQTTRNQRGAETRRLTGTRPTRPSDDQLDDQFARLGLKDLRHPRRDGQPHLWE